MMWMEIIDADYLDGYRLKISFNNGKTKVMDFSQVIEKYPVFKPLKNIELFKNFKVTDTLEWNEGKIDIAPEYVWEHASAI